MMPSFFPQSDEPNRAKDAVERFVERFDPDSVTKSPHEQPYRLLAFYAALPLVLTPELVNYLRNRFLRGVVPWIAEADLLLCGDLCRPVGYEVYRMDTAVRAYLLAEMRQHLGVERMQEVARLLLRYVDHLARTSLPFEGSALRAQRWAALAYLDDHRETVAQEIGEAFARLAPLSGGAGRLQLQAELGHLSRVTRELAPQLEDHPDLLAYAQNVGRLLSSSAGADMRQPDSVPPSVPQGWATTVVVTPGAAPVLRRDLPTGWQQLVVVPIDSSGVVRLNGKLRALLELPPTLAPPAEPGFYFASGPHGAILAVLVTLADPSKVGETIASNLSELLKTYRDRRFARTWLPLLGREGGGLSRFESLDLILRVIKESAVADREDLHFVIATALDIDASELIELRKKVESDAGRPLHDVRAALSKEGITEPADEIVALFYRAAQLMLLQRPSHDNGRIKTRPTLLALLETGSQHESLSPARALFQAWDNLAPRTFEQVMLGELPLLRTAAPEGSSPIIFSRDCAEVLGIAAARAKGAPVGLFHIADALLEQAASRDAAQERTGARHVLDHWFVDPVALRNMFEQGLAEISAEKPEGLARTTPLWVEPSTPLQTEKPNLDSAVMFRELGLALRAKGDLPGARAQLEHALEIREAVLGSDDADIAQSVADLGAVVRAQNDLKYARDLFERALAISTKSFGPNHPDIAKRLNDLGRLLRDTGDLSGAKPLFERALEIREKALGIENSDTARSMDRLGRLLQAEGDLPTAYKRLVRALEIREKIFGPDHLETAKSLSNVGRVLRDQGDIAGARALFERTLAIREKTLGHDHPATVRSRDRLARLPPDPGEPTAEPDEQRQSREFIAAVFRILDRQQLRGCAVPISRHYALTLAHVVPQTAGASIEGTSVDVAESGGNQAWSCVGTVVARIPASVGPLPFLGHGDADLALIRLGDPWNGPTFWPVSADAWPGQKVFSFAYSHERPPGGVLTATVTPPSPVLRYELIGAVTAVHEGHLEIAFKGTVAPGASGAPIWDERDDQLLGLIVAVTTESDPTPRASSSAPVVQGRICIASRIRLPQDVVALVQSGSQDEARPREERAGGTSRPYYNYTVPELARAYDFPDGDGAGQVLGVIELGGGYLESDLQKYFAEHLGRPVPKITSVSVDGAQNQPTSRDASAQVTLDTEISGALAPGAEIRVYFAPNTAGGMTRAVERATRDRVSVILICWGWAEPAWNREELLALDDALRAAALDEITVVTPSGDGGATDRSRDARRQVIFPASSPWVLAVGGTTLTWRDGSIVSEVAWSSSDGSSATGGGISEIFERPAWQEDARVPSRPDGGIGRGIPDVAANADPQRGCRILHQGEHVVVGGTSVAAALWAGLILRLNQQLGQNVGYLTPKLYERHWRVGALRNITLGNNSMGGVEGFSAGPGWSAVTGWGSPNGRALLKALRTGMA